MEGAQKISPFSVFRCATRLVRLRRAAARTTAVSTLVSGEVCVAMPLVSTEARDIPAAKHIGEERVGNCLNTTRDRLSERRDREGEIEIECAWNRVTLGLSLLAPLLLVCALPRTCLHPWSTEYDFAQEEAGHRSVISLHRFVCRVFVIPARARS
jgi:hypothetical protein